MTDDLIIRNATVDDVPLILRFIRELAEYEQLANLVVATEESLRESLFERRYAEVVIAELAGKPTGFALFFHNYSTFLGRPGIYLEDLYVMPDLRGRGIGRALLSWLASLAIARNCNRLEWAVLNWNEPAILFYQHLGALPMDQVTGYRLSGEALEAVARNAPRTDLRQPG